MLNGRELLIVSVEPEFMVYPESEMQLAYKDSFSCLKELGSFGIIPEDFSIGGLKILLVMKKDKNASIYYNNGYIMATVANMELLESETSLNFTGICRARVTDVRTVDKEEGNPYLVGNFRIVKDDDLHEYFLDDSNTEKIRRYLDSTVKLIQRINARPGDKQREIGISNLVKIANRMNKTSPDEYEDVVTCVWNISTWLGKMCSPEKKFNLLYSDNILERMNLLLGILKEVAERQPPGGNQMTKGTKNNSKEDSGKKKDFEDVSDPDLLDDEFCSGYHDELKRAWKKFLEVRQYLNHEAKGTVIRDVLSLKAYGSPQANSHEWPKTMKHLETLVSLPWGKVTGKLPEIEEAERVLEEDHACLAFVKKNILQLLGVKIMNPTSKSAILCFIGPPGVGKTSICKSIARALSRKYVRCSVGGINDEAWVRGHRTTYVGSKLGNIMDNLLRCGTMDPVFVLDEIDKMGHGSTSGDPSSAMLEVLDPEQNFSFSDHYLDCPFDLSQVLFICTANSESDIPSPLRDRMEIIRLPGYLEFEKLEIAKRFLVPRQMVQVGLRKTKDEEQVDVVDINWSDEIIYKIIREYTNEAGVRRLEQTIAVILRQVVQEYLRKKAVRIKNIDLNEELILKLLGPPKFTEEKARPTGVGEAVGLVWTPVGGDIIYVQTALFVKMPGDKTISQTGRLGDVLKDANKLASTYLRQKFEFDKSVMAKMRKYAVHIHIPEGAVPKDGPSAGITAVISICSAYTGQIARPFVAMSGEIDNKGNVLPVGGIREKVVGAEKAGIKEIILAKQNKRNLVDVPKSATDNITFHFVEKIEDVLEIAFQESKDQPVYSENTIEINPV